MTGIERVPVASAQQIKNVRSIIKKGAILAHIDNFSSSKPLVFTVQTLVRNLPYRWV